MENTELVEILRTHGLKVTSTRLDVLSVISSNTQAIPLSAIQNALEDFDRVTLYRTVNALIDNGIIHKALVDGNETFYAMCSNSCTPESHHHHHIHFKCTSCQSVSCVQAKNEILLSIPNHTIEDFTIEVIGVCATCQN